MAKFLLNRIKRALGRVLVKMTKRNEEKKEKPIAKNAEKDNDIHPMNLR
jgi:hypothetical protein